jgi:hypothetical protein
MGITEWLEGSQRMEETLCGTIMELGEYLSVASLRSHNWGLRNFTWMHVQVIEDLDGQAGTRRK